MRLTIQPNPYTEELDAVVTLTVDALREILKLSEFGTARLAEQRAGIVRARLGWDLIQLIQTDLTDALRENLTANEQ